MAIQPDISIKYAKILISFSVAACFLLTTFGYFVNAIPHQQALLSNWYTLLLKLYGALLVLLSLPILRSGWRNCDKTLIWLIGAQCAAFALSMIINHTPPSPMMIVGLAATSVLYQLSTLPRNPAAVPDRALLAMLVYLVLPVILLFLFKYCGLPGLADRNSDFVFFRGQSFRGLAQDRTEYSLLAGLLFLFLITSHSRKYLIMALMLLPGLLLSESRASVLGLAGALVLLAARNRKARVLFYWMVALISIYFLAFSNRPMLLSDPGDRMDIMRSAFNAIAGNPDILWFGSGHFSTYAYVKAFHHVIPAHNLVLQTILNFGLPTLLVWCTFLYILWRKATLSGKMLFVYWFCYAFFQAGFDGYLMMPLNFLGLVLIASSQKLISVTQEKTEPALGRPVNA